MNLHVHIYGTEGKVHVWKRMEERERGRKGEKKGGESETGIYRHFIDYWFIYKLNTKTSYSWLTKPKTLKLNAKTGGGGLPPEPP